MKSVEEIKRESFDAGDAWAVTKAKEAVHAVALLASPAAVSRMRELPVTNDDQEAFATQLLREVMGEWKGIDEQRKTISKPLNEALKAANAVFKPALEALKEEEGILKDKLAAYLRAKEEANRAYLATAREATTPQLAQQSLAFVAPVAPPPGVSIRQVWKFEVTDPNIVPREYCSPDPKKIGAVDPTTTAIPGVRFFQEDIVSARRK